MADPATPPAKAGKGSKAACEAAGWKFLPLASVYRDTKGKRHRYEGSRGTMAVPPDGSGIEPRQFGGSILAVRWAVEQLGSIAKQPEEAPAGMDGVRLLLSAALASGEICGGPDETPERPDADLLSICRDALEADRSERANRGVTGAGMDRRFSNALSDAVRAKRKAAELLPTLHATTREGLLQKARAAALLPDSIGVTGNMATAVFQSLVADLIHLVPTLINERCRPVIRPAGDAEEVA